MNINKKLQEQLEKITKSKDVAEIVDRAVETKVRQQWLIISLIVTVFIIAVLVLATVMVYEIKYKDKFFPGTRIGYLNLSGLSKEEAKILLDETTENISSEEIKFTYKNGDDIHLKITPAINAISDPDLSRELVVFDNTRTLSNIYQVGRNGNMINNFLSKLSLLFKSKTFASEVDVNESMMRILIHQELSELENLAENARPSITWNDDVYQIELLPSQEGVIINYDDAISQAKYNLSKLENKIIEISSYQDTPSIVLSDIENKKYLLDQTLATTTPKLFYENKNWNMSLYDLSQMIEFQHDDKNEIVVGLNYNNFNKWVDKNIASIVNVKPKDASIEIEDGRVKNFEAHRDGKSVNVEETYNKINSQVKDGGVNEEVVVDITTPNIVTKDVNDLGINELLGTGHSNFSGSPANRRHNIRTGANSLHGLLIKPDEEFSLIKALGDIDGENGYLQELVIKGDKTIPEYGGGLCQIGTTAFRATMATGLPVTARRNHSYSVSYYLENGLPGTDATIYDPYPDYRFKNDTGNYILIQARIEGDDLYFDFWGTSDGRTSERTTPRVWGWTSPPPTKYVETLDLPVGVTKCTESSHKGVSASFEYTINYADGKKDETTFSSTYKPWQAVCLIGVEKLSEPEGGNTTSTDETL